MVKEICGAVILCLCFGLFGGMVFGCTRAAPVHEIDKARTVSDEQYKKEMEEIKKTMRGDIKIKLKKDGKGCYSWEISGKDAYEVVKTNNILSKKVNGDRPGQD